MYSFVHKMPVGFEQTLMLHVEFYHSLLFRCRYDSNDMAYKCEVRVPPGKHCISLFAITIQDPTSKPTLKLSRQYWRYEQVRPLSGEIRADVDAPARPAKTFARTASFYTSRLRTDS